jgi:hypothetical protein
MPSALKEGVPQICQKGYKLFREIAGNNLDITQIPKQVIRPQPKGENRSRIRRTAIPIDLSSEYSTLKSLPDLGSSDDDSSP